MQTPAGGVNVPRLATRQCGHLPSTQNSGFCRVTCLGITKPSPEPKPFNADSGPAGVQMQLSRPSKSQCQTLNVDSELSPSAAVRERGESTPASIRTSDRSEVKPASRGSRSSMPRAFNANFGSSRSETMLAQMNLAVVHEPSMRTSARPEVKPLGKRLGRLLLRNALAPIFRKCSCCRGPA
jgi:hypothetical protein